MTPEANDQFNFNMDTIARFSGFMTKRTEPLKFEEEEAHIMPCDFCKKDIEDMEYKRNNGLCDRCAIETEIK